MIFNIFDLRVVIVVRLIRVKHSLSVCLNIIPVSSPAAAPRRCTGCNRFGGRCPSAGSSSPSDRWWDTGSYWEETPGTPSCPPRSPSLWHKRKHCVEQSIQCALPTVLKFLCNVPYIKTLLFYSFYLISFVLCVEQLQQQ